MTIIHPIRRLKIITSNTLVRFRKLRVAWWGATRDVESDFKGRIGGSMAAMDDVELFEETTRGVHTIRIRNKSRDWAIQASVHVGGACSESVATVTIKPLGEVEVSRHYPTRCRYEIESASYMD